MDNCAYYNSFNYSVRIVPRRTRFYNVGEFRDRIRDNMAPYSNVLALTRFVVSAYVRKNPLPAAEIPNLIRTVHGSLAELTGGTVSEVQQKRPAIAIKKSITDEYLICLEDGKKCRTLKRYLHTRHKLTPDEYRAKWGLPADYPMTAPGYSAQRSALAK